MDRILILWVMMVMVCTGYIAAQGQRICHFEKTVNTVLLAKEGSPLAVMLDADAGQVVRNAAQIFSGDLEAAGFSVARDAGRPAGRTNAIIIGTLGDNLIRDIVARKKIPVSSIQGAWEHFSISHISNPVKGVADALLIIGSDERGAAFGALEVSAQLGVSPWSWWADVPVVKRKALYIEKKLILVDGPRVKYRGIFINDEAPALSSWTAEQFGGFNHRFYEKVFTLMLRLRANYIWPAMWGRAFYDDDSLNIQAANRFGIIIGTSHHEPMMRAHDEWRRYGEGTAWNYDRNEERLRGFWREGLERAQNEKIVTVGMRGDGDEPMSDEVATELLTRIIADQRRIITEVTGEPAYMTPQLWALYKEVQEYYDQGMRIPEDITLLFCDDNWGNVRRLPERGAAARPGGYGMYYHFDYVGGPRNYKWLNTNYLPRIWDQMTLCYQHGIDRIWIVNVGDIKPMELPVSFFLDIAWAPDRFQYRDIRPWLVRWSAAQFGERYSARIADLLLQSSKLISLRKPELLSASTLTPGEFEQIVGRFDELLHRSEAIQDALADEYGDAYYQLVHHPIEAMGNLYSMYFNQSLNHRAYLQKNKAANVYAGKVRQYYTTDSLITAKYHALNGGKWNHMMSQTHIGYTYWQQPERQILPPTFRLYDWEAVQDEPILPSVLSPAGVGQVLALDQADTTATGEGIQWLVMPDYGRYEQAVTTWPFNHRSFADTDSAPAIRLSFWYEGTADTMLYLRLYHSPTLDVFNSQGLKYAVSVNDGPANIYSLNEETGDLHTWEKWVADNIITTTIPVGKPKPGENNITIHHLDPGIILQRAVVSGSFDAESYLGPHPLTADE